MQWEGHNINSEILLLKMCNVKLNMRHIRQSQIEAVCKNNWPAVFKSVKSMNFQEKMNYSGGNMWFWIIPFHHKGTLLGHLENFNGIWRLDGNNVSRLLSQIWWCYYGYVEEYSCWEKINTTVLKGNSASGQ